MPGTPLYAERWPQPILESDQGDNATYFSGPKFINTVRKFEPYFPNYNQFISQRNVEGKRNKSRTIFYYDILLGLKDETRTKVVKRIIEIVRPFQADKAPYVTDE